MGYHFPMGYHITLGIHRHSYRLPRQCVRMCEDTDTWDSETLTKATGFLHTIASSSFMVSFIVVRNCLRYLKPLTVKLQKLEKDIVEAYKEISIVSTTISTLRENVDTVFGRVV
ncbi:hypothetical protein ACOMHN_052777 [Nucella lapillus]